MVANTVTSEEIPNTQKSYLSVQILIKLPSIADGPVRMNTLQTELHEISASMTSICKNLSRKFVFCFFAQSSLFLQASVTNSMKLSPS
jgi:hypothetical protein